MDVAIVAVQSDIVIKVEKKCQGRVLLVDKHFGFTLDLL